MYDHAISMGINSELPTVMRTWVKRAQDAGFGNQETAAVIKALRKEDDTFLADRVYSGVPASLFGAKQRIDIGPMSGRSNVIYWLESRGMEASEERVTLIFEAAKESPRLLTDDEVERLAGQV